jgi:hypothetical protein
VDGIDRADEGGTIPGTHQPGLLELWGHRREVGEHPVVRVADLGTAYRSAVREHRRPGAVEPIVAIAVRAGQQQRLLGSVLGDREQPAVGEVEIALEIHCCADLPVVVERLGRGRTTGGVTVDTDPAEVDRQGRELRQDEADVGEAGGDQFAEQFRIGGRPGEFYRAQAAVGELDLAGLARMVDRHHHIAMAREVFGDAGA